MKNQLLFLLLFSAQLLDAQHHDCASAMQICSKSGMTIPASNSSGLDGLELQNMPCFTTGAPTVNEVNSNWFTWTCSAAGTLMFVASPVNPEHDLDFVVFRIPAGGTCADRVVERCMAMGALDPQSPCMGPTGLSIGNTDVNGNAGCMGGDNFLAPLQMQVGETYVLCLVNFTGGAGFNLSFGGSAEVDCGPASVGDFKPTMVRVYPNPAQDALRIDTHEAYATARFCSIDGREVLSHDYQPSGIYDTQSLVNGSYVLLLLDADGRILARELVVISH